MDKPYYAGPTPRRVLEAQAERARNNAEYCNGETRRHMLLAQSNLEKTQFYRAQEAQLLASAALVPDQNPTVETKEN